MVSVRDYWFYIVRERRSYIWLGSHQRVFAEIATEVAKVQVGLFESLTTAHPRFGDTLVIRSLIMTR